MKKITIIILLIIWSNLSYSQTTSIPDTNFEQALIDLSIDSNGLNGNILNTDAESVTELIVAEKNISNLTGIEAFTNLTILRCNQNNLTSLNLASNLDLEYLFCWSNDLTALDLSTNSQLQILYCAENSLTTLDLTNNLLLQNLVCWGNDLASLIFANNTMLYSISCDDNNLTSLDVSSLTNLEDLYCGENAMTSIDVSANTSLLTLDCYGLQLADLDLSNNPSLEELYADNNNLTALNLEDKPFLKRLSCKNNLLTQLNVRNGNNTNVTLFRTNGNEELLCIDVDYETYSTSTWTFPSNIDSHTNFSVSCDGSLSNNEFDLNDSISLHPNPTSNRLNIDFESTVDLILVYNILGEVVAKTSNQNHIDFTHLETGMYLVKMQVENKTIVKKAFHR